MAAEDFPDGLVGKESACNAADRGLIPESRRSPGEGNGYSIPILAWKTPWMEEPGWMYSPWNHKESDMTEHLTLHFRPQI